MDFILFGMQGAGKGTVGKTIAEKYGMKIFEMGGELRKLSQEDSELGLKVKSIIEAGKLVSDEIIMEIVENFMDKLPKNASVVFDGIPRKIQQAKLLNAVLDKHNREYKAVLIDISEKTALKRLTTRRICKKCKAVYPVFYEKNHCETILPTGGTCNGELITRSDDNPQAIKTRLEAFAVETIPAIELYKDKLVKIDGEPQIEEVAKTTIETLDGIIEK